MSDHRNESAPAGQGGGAEVLLRDAVQGDSSTGNADAIKPAALPAALPAPLAALAEEPTFCLYKTAPSATKPGKLDKRPCNYLGEVADANAPRNHMSAELACQWAAHYGPPYGVAKVFPPGGKFFFLDIDNCMQDDGQWSPLAQTLMQRLAGCAVEVSASGRGLHIFGRGPVPEHGCRNTALGLELYTEGRFVALTGTNAVGDAGHTPPPDVWQWLVPTYFPPRAGGAGGGRGADWTDGPCPEWRGPTDDAELLRRAMRSQSGKAALFGRAGFADLWEARTDVLANTYPADASGSGAYNASSADAALAQHLSFWTGRDCARIERLMRQSALARSKWDDREDYLPRTILGAVAGCRDVLQDREVEPALPTPPALLPVGLADPITPAELYAARSTPRVILPGLLYADVRSRIAPGGVGKTTLALFEAVTLALERPLWGKHPPRPVRTVVVTREDSRELLVARLREIIKAMNLTPAETADVLDRVLIVDLSDTAFRLSTVVADVVVPDRASLDWLAGVLNEFRPDWVIFDPVVSFGVGESRVNDAEQGLIEAFRILRNRLNCCIEGIHHSGKANAREKALDQYAGRGGSALSDGCRMVVVMQPLDAGEWLKEVGSPLAAGETGIVMALPKLSFAPTPGKVYIRRRGYVFETASTTTTTPEQEAEATAARVLEFIRKEYAAGRKYGKEGLRNSKDQLGLTRGQVDAAIARLESSGAVAPIGGQGRKGSHLAPVNFEGANCDL